MNIVDRRPNPKGKSLSNRQRFLERARAEVKGGGAGRLAQAQGRPMSRMARRSRSRRAASPSRSSTTIAAPAAPTTSSPATRNMSRRRDPAAARRRRRRRLAKAAPTAAARMRSSSRCPRTSSSTCSSRISNCPTSSRRALKDTTAVDLQRAGYTVTGIAVQPQHSAHHAQQHGAAHLAAAAEARARSRRCAKRSRRPRRAAPTRKSTRLTLRARTQRAAQQDHPLYRPGRRALPPLRARAEAEHRSGDVLPDGRVGLDDRGDEGPRQAVLHAAARLPDAALPACRRRLHPPHLHRRGGRRGDVLLQPRDRRHGGLDRARKDAGDRPRALSDRPLEHLCARRPRTATITAPTAAAACRCSAARCCRSASISPISRSATARAAALPASSRDSDLWRAYSEVAPAHAHFAMRRVGDPAQIFSVFHELFAKGGVRA